MQRGPLVAYDSSSSSGEDDEDEAGNVDVQQTVSPKRASTMHASEETLGRKEHSSGQQSAPKLQRRLTGFVVAPTTPPMSRELQALAMHHQAPSSTTSTCTSDEQLVSSTTTDGGHDDGARASAPSMSTGGGRQVPATSSAATLAAATKHATPAGAFTEYWLQDCTSLRIIRSGDSRGSDSASGSGDEQCPTTKRARLSLPEGDNSNTK